MMLTSKEVAAAIDHTFLKPDGRKQDIEKLCREAREYSFANVAVPPFFVPFAAGYLSGTGIGVVGVVGFPLGFMTTKAKTYEAREMLESGAAELDMVLNIGLVKEHCWSELEAELNEVACTASDAIFKVILETCYLTEEEIIQVTRICREIENIDYVKTSTGWGPGGARSEDVKLMKREAKNNLKVKASGGIRTKEDYLIMRKAGADRIGTSSGVAIVKAFD